MKKDINIEIGERVRIKRKAAGYTREKLSEYIDISPQFLAEIESGKKGMSFATLKRLCQVLGVSCDYMILGREDAAENPYPQLVHNILEGLSPDCGKAVFDIAAIIARSVARDK